MPLLKTSRTSLSGKTAIVTGASAGIGRQIAIRLAEEGLQVVLAARNVEKLEELAAQLHRQGRTAISVPTDVVQHEQLVRLVQRVKTEFGRIDILVNNAGVGTFHDFHTLPLPEVRKAIDVNLTAAIELSQLVLPSMLEFRWGRIVNMASTAGKHGPAFGAVYRATKAALIAFTQSLRSEYHGTGVSATAICPGFTNDGGIYERMKAITGRGSPWLVGSTSVAAVADATVRAIQRDLPEVIVNHPPLRRSGPLPSCFPGLESP